MPQNNTEYNIMQKSERKRKSSDFFNDESRLYHIKGLYLQFVAGKVRPQLIQIRHHS